MISGVPNNLESICFPVDSSEGWVCGGSVIRHFNNGNWVADQFKPSGDYNALFLTDNQNGWAVGDRIIHTTDGQNWTEQTNPDTQDRAMLDVFFLNENEGWIVGNQGLILHTINGGTEWTIQADGLTTSLLTGVQFTSSTNGYITGNNKTFLKYTRFTSVSEMKRTIDFELFPNPANHIVRIKCTAFNTESGMIEIHTLAGKTQRKKTVEKGYETIEIALKGRIKGIYICRITIGNKSSTRKLIIE